MTVKETLKTATISAMKAGEKSRLLVLRTASAAIKQCEIDTQTTLSSDEQLAVIAQLIKQRKDSEAQFRQANRLDLAEKEQAEIAVLTEFLPAPLSEAEIHVLIDAAIEQTAATGVGDMRQVMDLLKPKLLGRADLGQVSQWVKLHLSRLT
ncbi:GatB/YqeY domain-containing protein [Ostreibacterium oceani]|uniref:GatB/YqeY domain-containing protein n=1 Tax=Ostreibacterium oceani TaxID=2654998 RepID=A0A6N7EUV3_9GAMM|nr:GatB/YqeY domain-containing protein [Ostreibacterium oceani]MPV86341.1 GatB/YqeY domain-containing protein [Ostreibacterium oceani]